MITVCLVSAILNPFCCTAVVPAWSFSSRLILIFSYPSKLCPQVPGKVEKVDEDSSKYNIDKEIAQKVCVSSLFDQNFGIHV